MRFIDRVSYWSGTITSFLIYAMLGSLLIEVIARYAFNSPTSWAHDVATYSFGAYFMLGAAYALRSGRMISVDIIFGRLSRRNQAIVNSLTFIFFLSVCYVLIWQSGHDALLSWNARERSIYSTWGPPLYPLKMVVPIATFMLLLQGVANVIREVTIALGGNASEDK